MSNIIPFLLGRSLRSKNQDGFRWEFIMMVLGIIISITVVSAAINLFEGYQRALKKILLNSSAHQFVYSDLAANLSTSQVQTGSAILLNQPEVLSVHPVVANSAMVRHGSSVRGCILRAYDADKPLSGFWFAEYLSSGKLALDSHSIIIGDRLASDLQISIGDSLTLLYPQTDKFSPLGLIPRSESFRVNGTVRTGYYEMDRALIITTAQAAFDFYLTGKEYTYLEVKLKDKFVDSSYKLSKKYQTSLGNQFQLRSWEEFNGNLLALIAIEKWLIFLVFSFLVVIAALNSISTVSTSILERKKEIALLKTMGLTDAKIRQFIYLRVLVICVFSVLAGLLLGSVAAWLITQQSFYQLKGDVYFIDQIVMHISLLNYAVIFISAMLIIGFCVMFPLKYINRLQIVNVLRGIG
jgi:lipoprotein-releasing system permease protein